MVIVTQGAPFSSLSPARSHLKRTSSAPCLSPLHVAHLTLTRFGPSELEFKHTPSTSSKLRGPDPSSRTESWETAAPPHGLLRFSGSLLSGKPLNHRSQREDRNQEAPFEICQGSSGE